MRSPRSLILACAACTALLVSGCGSDSTSKVAAPLPTIGLGSEFGATGEPGVISGAADVRAIGADDVDSVVMIGDSITVAARDELRTRFELMGMTSVVLESQNSKRMAVSTTENPSGVAVARFLVDVAEDDGDHSNELWVVALGTNDVNQYSSPDQLAAAVNEVLGAVPEESPLVWVDTYFESEPEAAGLVNSIVRDRIERRGNAVIAPWSLFAPADGVMTADGIHPTESGNDVFAFVVADTVQAFLDR